MALYKREGSPYWWADIRVKGKPRLRISTEETTKAAARTVETAIIHKLSCGEKVGGKPILLRDFSDKFLTYVENSRLEDKTKDYYKNGWRMLSGQSIAGMRIDTITTRDAAVLDIPGSGSNVNNALRTLKRMLTIAEEMRIIDHAPRIKLAKELGRERLINPEEEKLILDHAKPILRDVFLLIFDTGMRPGEACRLKWENVDFLRGVILIARGKSKQARRHLPMSSRVEAMLKERAKLDPIFLFRSKRGEEILPKTFSRYFRNLRNALGLSSDIVLYSARHTFATDFMGATGDISKTSKTLGHGNINITTRYLHPAVSDLRSIMDSRNQERHNFGHTKETVQ